MSQDQQPSSPVPLEIAMLVYPNMTLLDLVGPHQTFAHHGRIHLVWESLEPILTDSGMTIMPTATFDDCPRDLDVLFAPGGGGTFDVIENPRALTFMRDRAQGAKYVTSVCSGSLILAAAGLLDGRKAATHWAAYDILEELGAEGVRERVVIDGNCVTGGGVTAGIDFGLTVLAKLRGENVAKMTQLMMEYDPEPPFDAGSPEKAGPELVAMVSAAVGELGQHGMAVAKANRKQRLELAA